MIINVWKPNYKTINKIKIIIYYSLENINNIKNGWVVIYKCDICKSNKLYKTTTTSLLKSKWNNINHQICRSCRSKKSELNVKQNVITYKKFKKALISNGYFVLSNKQEFIKQNYPSQAKLLVKCPNGHMYYAIWNNFINKNKRCRQCYYNKQYEKSKIIDDKFLLYKKLVRNHSNKIYRKYFNKINEFGLKRSINDFHLDHKYSISKGYLNNIPVYIIGSLSNLEVIPSYDNRKKGKSCSITKEELFNEYFKKNRRDK